MWLACYTQDEIAEAVGCHQTIVGDVLRESADLPDSLKPVAAHLVDFNPPIYNIWKQQEKTAGWISARWRCSRSEPKLPQMRQLLAQPPLGPRANFICRPPGRWQTCPAFNHFPPSREVDHEYFRHSQANCATRTNH
jgi:hypothetical protein